MKWTGKLIQVKINSAKQGKKKKREKESAALRPLGGGRGEEPSSPGGKRAHNFLQQCYFTLAYFICGIQISKDVVSCHTKSSLTVGCHQIG